MWVSGAGRPTDCRVPLHMIAFDQDAAAPPQGDEEVAALCPTAEYHLFEGMGHCSIYGHTHDVLIPFIRGIVERHLQSRAPCACGREASPRIAGRPQATQEVPRRAA